MKRFVACVLSGAMLSAACLAVACGGKGDDDGVIDLEIDLSAKPTLSVLMPNSGYDETYINNDPNAAVVKEVTGYDVKYSQLPALDSYSALQKRIMNRDRFNAIKVTTTQFANLLADDVLAPLNDAIDKFGPVLKEVISEESWESVTKDGKIYGIPERSSSDNIQYPVVFRQDWLDELKLPMPTTPKEFESTLVAMKERYNITPLTFNRYTPIVWAVAAGFGIYAEWQEYDINGSREVRFYMDAPTYPTYVDYMARLYANGLIDPEVNTNEDANALTKFTSGQAGAISTSIWSVPQLVAGLVPAGPQQNVTQESLFGYLRALRYNGEEHANRLGGCPYVTVIPYYTSSEGGYVIDWINSKLTDTEEQHNFRKIVLGEEDYHWTYDPIEDVYNPIKEHFSEKDTASYYLTGSNELVYTQYWLARVKKQPEMERAWKRMMRNADTVGVYDVLDTAPPLETYASVIGQIALDAQEKFILMIGRDGGTSNYQTYLTQWKANGGDAATREINDWYYGR